MENEILIIDDDVELCAEFADFLRSSGYSVENTSSSAEGEKLIEHNTFDMVILDFKMSGFNGIDLLKKIKSKNQKTSVFFISGKPSLEKMLMEENLISHVEGIINKPFSPYDLLEKIEKRIKKI